MNAIEEHISGDEDRYAIGQMNFSHIIANTDGEITGGQVSLPGKPTGNDVFTVTHRLDNCFCQ